VGKVQKGRPALISADYYNKGNVKKKALAVLLFYTSDYIFTAQTIRRIAFVSGSILPVPLK
jgi:hypothetical protein